MNLNEIVCNELSYIPFSTKDEKHFRAIFQRERLKVLSKQEEATGVTLLRIIDGLKINIRINPRIFIFDMLGKIKPHVPSNFVIETTEEDIEKWYNLPAGKTIIIFRPEKYLLLRENETKDFMGWFNPTHAYALTCYQQGGIIDFSLITSYCNEESSKIPCNTLTAYVGFPEKSLVSNLRRYFPPIWNLDEEINRYKTFVNSLEEFMIKGNF
jgi:hypothetical protein